MATPCQRHFPAYVGWLLVAVHAAPAAAIPALKPPQREMTERVSTDKGPVTVIYRPQASARELGCKPYRGTISESYFYQVRDPKGKPAHVVAGARIETPDHLWRIRDYYLKALPGAQARAAGNAKLGKYMITRDKGDEAIVIEATRAAGASRSTIRVRRVIEGKLRVNPGPTPPTPLR